VISDEKMGIKFGKDVFLRHFIHFLRINRAASFILPSFPFLLAIIDTIEVLRVEGRKLPLFPF